MVVSLQSTGRTWNAPSKLAGRQAGRLMAKVSEKIPVKGLDALHSYYEGKFGGRIPTHLSAQLDWAVSNHKELFSTLLKLDILPLDITVEDSMPITIVEFFRDSLQIDQWDNYQLTHDLPLEIKYLEVNKFGALLRRGQPNYMELFNRRLELLPVARPSEALAAKSAGSQLKAEALKTVDSQDKTPLRQGFKLSRPGIVCNQGYANSLSTMTSEGRIFHRQCWANFDDPTKAIEYLLAGGEMSRALREDPGLSIFSLVKKINRELGIFDPRVRAWMGDGWSIHDRPFISVTTNPEIIPVIRVQGNLFIQIETYRAFKVITNITSFTEREWLVPFVINPAEIVHARLALPGGDINMRFMWSADFTKLEVACDSGYRHSLHYSFDPVKRGYRPDNLLS